MAGLRWQEQVKSTYYHQENTRECICSSNKTWVYSIEIIVEITNLAYYFPKIWGLCAYIYFFQISFVTPAALIHNNRTRCDRPTTAVIYCASDRWNDQFFLENKKHVLLWSRKGTQRKLNLEYLHTYRFYIKFPGKLHIPGAWSV